MLENEFKKQEIEKYFQAHKHEQWFRLKYHPEESKRLSNEELEKLGKKDEEKAVEEFISANSVELAKDKWLCPLSGKKFKGPEFIRKHLHLKHEDKLNEIRREVLYFNNYLSDPFRPHNSEPKPAFAPTLQTPGNFYPTPLQSVAVVGQEDRRTQDFENRNVHRGNWQGNDRGGSMRYPGLNSGRGSLHGFMVGNRVFKKPKYSDPSGDGGRRDPRQQISYRDLDAPEEIF